MGARHCEARSPDHGRRLSRQRRLGLYVFDYRPAFQRQNTVGGAIDMPDLLALCERLDQSAMGTAVRESLWLFPAIETVHLLGMAALVGTVGVLDLRLLGWLMRRERVSELASRLLPWAWAGFALQVITGALLFSSEAVKVYGNPAFRLKMLLILLTGVHALVFHWIVNRDVASWDDSAVLPVKAKVSGLVSILLWVGIVAAGRFIGFV